MTNLRLLVLTVAGVLVLGAGIARADQQAFPAWTGARFPFTQHFDVMMLHFDQATQAFASAAAGRTTDARVKALAQRVSESRKREADALTKVFQGRYGSAPPSWPGYGGGYGPHKGGYQGGHPAGTGPGMMGGYGGPMTGGHGGPAAGGPEVGSPEPGGPYYYPMGYGYMSLMMGYGDAYQVMLGQSSGTLTGSAFDHAFVVGLARQDAMEISLATLALESGDSATRERASSILTERTKELEDLVGAYRAQLTAVGSESR